MISCYYKSIRNKQTPHVHQIKEVYTMTPLPPSISSSTFKGVIHNACRVMVPRGAKNNYKKDKSWNKFAQIIEN